MPLCNLNNKNTVTTQSLHNHRLPDSWAYFMLDLYLGPSITPLPLNYTSIKNKIKNKEKENLYSNYQSMRRQCVSPITDRSC